VGLLEHLGKGSRWSSVEHGRKNPYRRVGLLNSGLVRAWFGLGMISTATMRRLGPWLVGLYVLAMVAGVMPLIRACNAHTIAPLAVSESGAPAQPQDHHHAGDTDDVAHHHALQDLTGVLDSRLARTEIAVVHSTMIASPTRALAEADPVLLERPPKTFLSI
jgi:hypothetical protein